MRNVKFGETDKWPVKRQNVTGIVLFAYLQHTTVNTAFTGQPLDFSKVNVSAILKRGGKNHVIFDDIALPLLLDSGFLNADYEQVNGVSSTFRTLTAQGASQDHIISISAEIKFHDIINLSGEDELIIEINPIDGAQSSTVDTSSSYIGWDVKEGVGNAASIPFMKVETVQAGKSSESFSLGDNVKTIFFGNNDKSGISSANQVITSIQITSDKLNRRDTYQELLSKRARKFPSVSLADARHQSFILLDVDDEKLTGENVRLNEVDLRLSLNSGNVNASDNWIVYRGYINDVETFERAKVRHTNHKVENMNQYV